MKKNVSDTLTFLHQERNDFLPEDDIIIPSRKDDHISNEINLDSIKSNKKSSSSDYFGDTIRDDVIDDVKDVIKQAEDIVNDMKLNDYINEMEKDEILQNNNNDTADSVLDDFKTLTEDSLDNLDSLKDDSSTAQEKSEEAFRFLENEASSPILIKNQLSDDFLQKEIDSERSVTFSDIPKTKSNSSNIPLPKQRQKIDKEKDIDLLFSEENDEFLSKIPVKASKVKTIKKHSKDPLKEFVNLARDVNWDDEDEDGNIDPIVKTTVTRISTTQQHSEPLKSKIPLLHTETLSPTELTERYEVDDDSTPQKNSKIPVLKTESTRIHSPPDTICLQTNSPTQIIETTTILSPGSRVSTKSSTLDSDSDDDSIRQNTSPPLKGILKKTSVRTVGSSSGSDVALHEEGAELSDDESGTYRIK